MLGSCEASEIFALLEGGAGGAREASEALSAVLASVREPWLTRALLQYHARTGSVRVLELLARAPEHQARFLLDALQEQLRAERPADRAAQRHALAALAPLVARRPAWLHRLPAHPLIKELLRAARCEPDPLPLLHALLALAALLPAAPAIAVPHCAELAEALLRPIPTTAWHPATAAHVHLAKLALFRAVYATHPCTLLEALRNEHAVSREAARDASERALVPLLESVRLHPHLVTGSRQREADQARWARFELHDIVAESRRLSLPARDTPLERVMTPRLSRVILAAPASLPPPDPPVGSGAHAARACASLRPGTEPWFALNERCGADSAPQTPLPADADAAEPPEAAVEATPENTPAKETRAQFRFPTESTTARALGGRRSQPPSPLRKETSPSAAAGGLQGDAYGGRLTRVARDRAALEAESGAVRRRAPESPIPFGGAPPPAGVARPEPSRAPPALDAEDREVLELTSLSQHEEVWSESEGGAGAAAGGDVAAAWGEAGARVLAGREWGARSVGGSRGAPPAPPARRAASCPPRAHARILSVATQTVDVCPEPYEFITTDVYRSLPVYATSNETECPVSPTERLDKYMSELYTGRAPGAGGPGGAPGAVAELHEQLALAHAQLMYERWRREAHAERNRRLLGRCREVRALELSNAALRVRLREATRERDELRARAESRRAPGAVAVSQEALEALEAALGAERAARARSEAALREAEAARARDANEVRRARGEAFEATRHVEALARAALAAERRSEHVRRLRRELLMLAEREARLTAAAKNALTPSSQHNNNPHIECSGCACGCGCASVRARAAAAQREAEAAAARGEAGAARAHELELQLAAKHHAAVELERAARRAQQEADAKLAALADKYRAANKLLRAQQEHLLRALADAYKPPAPRGRAAPAPLAALAAPLRAAPPGSAIAKSMNLTLEDCERTRALIEQDDDDDDDAH